MTSEIEWRKEWELLRADRARARRQWRSAADGLAAKAHDPLGLNRLIQGHPIAATGIGAAAGAILAKLFLGRKRARQGDARAGSGSVWSAMLRDAAISVALPWLVRMVKDKFGWDLAPGAVPESDEGEPADDESVARE